MNWLTLVVGPFFGAMLAFFSARMLDGSRRQRENLASANLALLTLKNQYNDFLLFRKGFLEDVNRSKLAGDEPLWALVRPTFLTFCSYEFDFKSLGFLFERPGNTAIFEEVELVQICHRDLVALEKLRTEQAVALQSTVAKFQKKNPNPTWLELEAELGRDVIETVTMIVIGLGIRAEENENTYLKAFSTLRDALEIEHQSHWLLNLLNFTFWRNGKPTHINVKEPLPNFRRAELPKLPTQLAEAIAKVRPKNLA